MKLTQKLSVIDWNINCRHFLYLSLLVLLVHGIITLTQPHEYCYFQLQIFVILQYIKDVHYKGNKEMISMCF